MRFDEHFFDAGMVPKSYTLRDKLNTQDDPLDEYICEALLLALPSGVKVAASGPLVTPDLVVSPAESSAIKHPEPTSGQVRSEFSAWRSRKLETHGNPVALPARRVWTTTPRRLAAPYGSTTSTAMTWTSRAATCLSAKNPRTDAPRTYRLTALVLCDGDLLNEDFDYYMSIVGRRSKEIGLGTYGDGANRVRPMLIFSNPLGTPFLDRQATLIHARADLEHEHPILRRIGVIERSIPGETDSGTLASRPPMEQTSSGEFRTFHCYRDKRDVPANTELFHKRDPFPIPRRSKKTAARGRFVIDFRPSR